MGRAPTVAGHVGLGALQGLGLALNVLGTNGIAEHKGDTICLEFQMMA